MEDQEIELLQKYADKKLDKQTLLRQREWDKKKSFYTYCDKYRKQFEIILRANVGNTWSYVYSKISEKIPPLAKQHFVDTYVYLPDRNGKYKKGFNPNLPAYWGDEYYVTTDGIFAINKTKNSRHKRIYPPKTKKKREPKLDPLFKFDYVLNINTWQTKDKKTLFGHVYIETGKRINDKGEEVPQMTRFTKDQFIDWAERHKKTYKLNIKNSYFYSGNVYETIIKTHYDE